MEYNFKTEKTFEEYKDLYKGRSDIYICHKYNFIDYSCAKNATQTIKLIICDADSLMFTNNGERVKPLTHQWNSKFGHLQKLYRDFIESNIDSLKKRGYITFMVYRDPWERFYSACMNKHISAQVGYRVITECLNEEGACRDPHFRNQYYAYNKNADYVVPIRYLDNFFINVLHIPENMIRHANAGHYTVDLTLTDEQKAYLNEYYKKDYELFTEDKLWKPAEE